MNDDQAIMEYDEDDAVAFIQNFLPQEMKGKFSEDEIIYIIDIIYDFYDEKGLLRDDVSDSDLEGIDDIEVANYVYAVTKKDKIKEYTKEEIMQIMLGELAYCDRFDE